MKSRIDCAMQFVEIVEMEDATGSEKMVAAMSVMTEVLLDCREILEGLDRRMGAQTMKPTRKK